MVASIMALFGNSGRSTNHGSRPGNLVEFRAGKMHMKGKMVHPDRRKGIVYVYQSEDALMHFCWKDRTSGTIEEDLIIFPDDVEFKSVPQCTTGRVFLLKFKNSSRKLFFWMQEPKSDKDEEYCKKVNEFLNDPLMPGLAGGLRAGPAADALSSLVGRLEGVHGDGAGGLAGLGLTAHSMNRPAEILQRQMLERAQTADSGRSSTSTPRTQASTVPQISASAAQQLAHQQFQLSELRGILSTMMPPGSGATAGSGGTGTGAGSAAPAPEQDPINLGAGLNPEIMAPILSDPRIQEQLRQHLPPGLDLSQEELRNTVNSPQFQQAMAGFSAALQSGQVAPLMAQFNLGGDVTQAAAAGDMEKFLEAMQAAHSEKSDKGAEKSDKKDTDKDKDKPDDKKPDDDDEAMSLD